MTTAKPTSPYRRLKIRYLTAGKTFSQVARKADVSPALITMVAQGKRQSKRIRLALARHIHATQREIWG